MDNTDPALTSGDSVAKSEPPTSPKSTSAGSSSQRPQTSFAFLVHSQDSVTNKLEPTVDNKALARQRRRRTSPEDQAILEQEFANNSKPDKSARTRIAARVALGEKEVQIWFQNRRSTARRRSGPIYLPEHLRDAHHEDDLDPQLSEKLLAAQAVASSSEAAAAAAALAEGEESHDTNQDDSPDFNREWSAFVSGAGQRSLEAASSQDAMSSMTDQQSTKAEASKTGEGQHSTSSTKSTPYSVRLSMTSDGGARILNSDESTPSPPRPSQSSLSPPSTCGLGRSKTQAVGLADSFSYSQNSQPLSASLRRSASGRSRDSRAWEFWCDSEARNDLAKHAEQDQKASAADAISLIRSNSNRKALTQINDPLNASRPSLKRAKSGHHQLSSKPSFKRSKSSGAKLSIPHDRAFAKSDNPDSDKENRDPSLHQMLQQSKDTFDPEQDEEIAGFMNGGGSLNSSTGGKRTPGEDMDCIQGLLSLSQGAWK